MNLIVYQIEFHKTRWSCPWNSDQNCTQNSARGSWGPGGGWVGGVGVVGVQGVGGYGVVGSRGGWVCGGGGPGMDR